MGIYSANRSGCRETSIVENANYDISDFGRIMYESEYNDMLIFNAIINADHRELQGLREGTILASELRELNEASAKEIRTICVERLKKFWAKIKAVISSAIDKLYVFFTRDGVKVVKRFESVKAQYEKNGGKEISVPYKKFKGLNTKEPTKATIEGIISDDFGDNIVRYGLGKLIDKDAVSPKEYRAAVTSAAFEDADLSSSNPSDVTNFLSNAKSSISTLVNTKKTAEKTVNEIISSMTSELSEADAKVITKKISACEGIITEYVNTCISVIRAAAAGYKRALGVIMAKMEGTVHGVEESVDYVMYESDMEFDDVFDNTNSADIDDATKAAIDTMVADVEANPVVEVE